jgi:hypothetical protein
VQEITDDEAIRKRDKSIVLQNHGSTYFHSKHPVDKIKTLSNTTTVTTRSRILSFNQDFILEVDTQSGTTHAVHRTNTVRCIIRSPDDDQTFGIEFTNGYGLELYKSEDRDIIILDLIELCQRSNNRVLITTEPTLYGMKEGLVVGPPDEEYADNLVKRLGNLEKLDSMDEKLRLLREFNMSFLVNDCPVKDKSPFRAVLKLYYQIYQDKQAPKQEKVRHVQLVLGALQRLLSYKPSFEDAATHKPLFEFLLHNSSSDDAGSRHFASAIMNDLVNAVESDTGVKHQSIIYASSAQLVQVINKCYTGREYVLFLDNILKMMKRSFDGKAANLEVTSKLIQMLLEIKTELYRLARSRSVSTSLAVLQLLTIISIRATNNELKTVQADVLSNGLIICIINDALFAECQLLRNVNLKLVDLLVSFNQECSELMMRIIPNALAKELDMSTIRREVSISKKKNVFGKMKIKQDSEYSTQTQNWASVLEQLKKDYVNAEIIWNDGTRNDLKQALEYQINALDQANEKYSENCTWNFIEFKVTYPSLDAEPRVGKYFLRYLAGEGKSQKIIIEDPQKLVLDLYYSLMLQEDESLRILTAKALTNIYVGELFPEHQPFPHTEHLIQVLTEGKYSKAVVFECLMLLSSAIQVWENADKANDKCIPLMMSYVKEVHNTNIQNDFPDPRKMASLALNILYQLSLFRTKHLREGQILRPIPQVIKNVTDYQNLPHIVQTIAVGISSHRNHRRKLLAQVIPLLSHVLNVNDAKIQSVYETGLFYLLFSFIEPLHEEAEDKSDEDTSPPKLEADAVQLLKQLGSKQHFNAGDFGLLESDNFLQVLLPDSLLNYMQQLSGSEFCKIFYGEHLSPTIIWNKEMRQHLQNSVQQHLQILFNKVHTDIHYKYEHTPLQRIIYPQIEKELFVHGYYLSGLLDPQWQGFVVTEPEVLFEKIVDRFKVETEEKNMITMLRVKHLLFDRIKSYFDQRVYLGAGKCFEILKNYSEELNGGNWNVTLAELTIRLLFFLSNSLNMDDYVKSNACNILLALLKAIHARFARLDRTDVELTKSLGFLLTGTLELINKLCIYQEMRDKLIADISIINILMNNFVNNDDIPVLRSVCKLMSQGLATIRPVVESLWNSGLLYFLVKYLSLVEESKINEARVKGALQVIIALNNQNPDLIFPDLCKIVPIAICKKLKTNKPDTFRTDILKSTESPQLIWTETCRMNLSNFIEERCSTLKQYYPQSNIVSVQYAQMKYPDIDNELVIADVFVRIFNSVVNSGTQTVMVVDDAKGFMNALVVFISDFRNKSDQHIDMSIEAMNNLLRHSEAIDNYIMLKQLIAECLSVYDAQQSLFKGLRELEKRSNTTTFLHLCDILKKCVTSSTFIQRMTALKVYHLISYAFIYIVKLVNSHQDADSIITCVLAIISSCLGDAQLAAQSQTNGIVLYILSIICGVIPASNAHRISAVKVMSVFCQNSDKNTVLALLKILPKPIVDFIASGSQNAVNMFQDNHETPDMIWNEEMRQELIAFLAQELYTHEQRVRNSDGPAEWKLNDSFSLKYAAIEPELQVAGVFVRIFNEKMVSGDYGKYRLQEPISFLQQSVIKLSAEVKNAEPDQYTVFLLQGAIYHVLMIDSIFAKNDILPESLPTLFKILTSGTSCLDNVILSIHLLYNIASSKLVLDRFASASYIDKLFDQMIAMPDYTELFLFIILAYTRQSSTIVRQLMNKERGDYLFNILRSAREQQIKLKAAVILKAMSMDTQHGIEVIESKSWKDFEEKWNSFYINIELPPVNVPLPIPVNTMKPSFEKPRVTQTLPTQSSITVIPTPKPTPVVVHTSTPTDVATPTTPLTPVRPPSPPPRSSLTPPLAMNTTTVPPPPPLQTMNVPPPPPRNTTGVPPPPPMNLLKQSEKRHSAPVSIPLHNSPTNSSATPRSSLGGTANDLLSSIRLGKSLKKVGESEKRYSLGAQEQNQQNRNTNRDSGALSDNPMLALMAQNETPTPQKQEQNDSDDDDEWDE